MDIDLNLVQKQLSVWFLSHHFLTCKLGKLDEIIWLAQPLCALQVLVGLASAVQERVKQGQPPPRGSSLSPSWDRKVRGEANTGGGLSRWKR